MLLFFRALVGVGEGAYGPSANTLLCADAPPEKRGRALGIYNVGMALGGTTGLALGAILAPDIGWRGVFWIAGGPSMLLALASAFIAAPGAPGAADDAARARVPALADVHPRAGGRHPGDLRRQRAHLLGALAGHRGAALLGAVGQRLHGLRRPGVRRGRRGRRRLRGRHARAAAARAGTRCAIGLSMLIAVPVGVGCLLVTIKPVVHGR